MAVHVIATATSVLAGPTVPLPAEVARAATSLRPADRDAVVACRVLAREVMARHAGVAAADVRFAQTCAQCGGPHGRPQVVGLAAHVGWSRSGGLVAAMADDVPCAIDVESVGAMRGGALPLDTLTPSERGWVADQPDRYRAFAELWVRKEVLVKLGSTTLDAVVGVDVTASLAGLPVLGRTLVGLDVADHDAAAACGR